MDTHHLATIIALNSQGVALMYEGKYNDGSKCFRAGIDIVRFLSTDSHIFCRSRRPSHVIPAPAAGEDGSDSAEEDSAKTTENDIAESVVVATRPRHVIRPSDEQQSSEAESSQEQRANRPTSPLPDTPAFQEQGEGQEDLATLSSSSAPSSVSTNLDVHHLYISTRAVLLNRKTEASMKRPSSYYVAVMSFNYGLSNHIESLLPTTTNSNTLKLRALSLYRIADTIRTKLCMRSGLFDLLLFNNLGVLHLQLNDHEKARQCHSRLSGLLQKKKNPYLMDPDSEEHMGFMGNLTVTCPEKVLPPAA